MCYSSGFVLIFQNHDIVVGTLSKLNIIAVRLKARPIITDERFAREDLREN